MYYETKPILYIYTHLFVHKLSKIVIFLFIMHNIIYTLYKVLTDDTVYTDYIDKKEMGLTHLFLIIQQSNLF